MPVNLLEPSSSELKPVPGVQIGVTRAGIRKDGEPDLTLIEVSEGSKVAGVFTGNKASAAPVQVCRDHLRDGQHIRALVINTGIANAGTGEAGLKAAHATCDAVARLMEIAPRQVLTFSTGVIMEELPVDRLIDALPDAHAHMRDGSWLDAARAIMTTDTVAKAASRTVNVEGYEITLTGVSKGSGMIKPNMATMLAFIATDVAISQKLLEQLTHEAAEESFNSITVDGDTSTNDSFVIMATGQKENPELLDASAESYRVLREAVVDLSIELAQAIVRDGEGATKFISVVVEGGNDRAECKEVAYSIAHSPLVKTAFFASDANLGRILSAIGNAEIEDLDTGNVRIWLGNKDENVLVSEAGGRAADYAEEAGARIMAGDEIVVRVDLQRGDASATVWTCDLSYDYVKINAEYRS